MDDKNQGTARPTKIDISKPKDFKHVSHVGLKTNTGNTLNSKKDKMPEPPAPEADQSRNEVEIESNLDKAGVSVSETHGQLDNDKAESQGLQSNTLRKKSKLTKEDIGYPYNFKHVSHVGWDINRGFDLDEASYADEFKSFFDKAGVSDIQLQDQETRDFIYNFIETHGGLETVKEDLHSVKHKNTLKNKKEKTPKADQSQNADELKSFFDKAGVSDIQLQDQETRDFIYNFIESHWGFNEYTSYHLRRTRQKNGEISEPQDFKHVLHVECEARTSDDDAPNADELKSSSGVSDTSQEDQETKELASESRGELDGIKKNLQDDKSRRRAPQPPPTPTAPVPTLSPPSPSTSSSLTAPMPVKTSSTETSDQAAPLGPKPSTPSPLTTRTAAPVPTDNPATASSPSTETPPNPPLSTTGTSTASTTTAVTSTASILSPPSPSSPKAATNKVTPPVATRRFVPLPLDSKTTAVPTLNVELTPPLKLVVPMPTIKPGSPLLTVRSTTPTATSTASNTISNTTLAMAPVPTLPVAVPRPARRPAPEHPARTPDSPTTQLKDSTRDTPTKTKDRLYKLVANGKYPMAVDLVKTLDKSVLHEVISDTIQNLLDSHSTAKAKLMSFAYKLWHSDAKSVVRIHFPLSFKLILGREDVKIVNKGYRQALRLDANIDSDNDGRRAWGDARDKSSKRVSWQLVPLWENNEVTFKLHNVDCNMFLKLAVEVDDDGDRAAWGSPNADTNHHKYYLEPYMEDEDLVFFIINFQSGQGLKLVVTPDDKGDRALMGHNGDIYRDEARFKWIISAW